VQLIASSVLEALMSAIQAPIRMAATASSSSAA
jgi:membrane glycosyltransferase